MAQRPSTAQQIALRVRIILRASQGESHGQISRELGSSKDISPEDSRPWDLGLLFRPTGPGI